MAKKKRNRVARKTALQITFLLLLLVVGLFLMSRQMGMGPRPVLQDERGTRPYAGATRYVSEGLELPAISDTTFIIRNSEGRYTLLYDTSCRQAIWVAYVLTDVDVRTNGVERQNRFRPDPQVVERRWSTAVTSDYTHSGYDRGHLLPSADRRATATENRATFYLSNISPQTPALNRGMWKRLEEQVRRWAECYDTLYVVTGSLLQSDSPRLKGSVGVPSRFYKAVLTRYRGNYVSMAFLLPNADTITGELSDYALTVDELEEISGQDFFCRLPDDIEEQAESRIDAAFTL